MAIRSDTLPSIVIVQYRLKFRYFTIWIDPRAQNIVPRSVRSIIIAPFFASREQVYRADRSPDVAMRS